LEDKPPLLMTMSMTRLSLIMNSICSPSILDMVRDMDTEPTNKDQETTVIKDSLLAVEEQEIFHISKEHHSHPMVRRVDMIDKPRMDMDQTSDHLTTRLDLEPAKLMVHTVTTKLLTWVLLETLKFLSRAVRSQLIEEVLLHQREEVHQEEGDHQRGQ